MSDLKPCPFCGNNPVINTATGWVLCVNAACLVNPTCDCSEHWNARSESQELTTLRQQNAELVEAIQSAINIKQLWLPVGSFSDCPPEDYRELEALHLMANKFKKLLEMCNEETN